MRRKKAEGASVRRHETHRQPARRERAQPRALGTHRPEALAQARRVAIVLLAQHAEVLLRR